MNWYWIEHVALILVLFFWARSIGKTQDIKEKLISHLESSHCRTWLTKGIILTKTEIFDKKSKKYLLYSEETDQSFEVTLPFEGHIGEVVGINFLRIKETDGDPFFKSRSKYWFTEPSLIQNSLLINFIYQMDKYMNNTVGKYYILNKIFYGNDSKSNY